MRLRDTNWKLEMGFIRGNLAVTSCQNHRYDCRWVNSGDSPRYFKPSRNLRVTIELYGRPCGFPLLSRSFNRYATCRFPRAARMCVSTYSWDTWWSRTTRRKPNILRNCYSQIFKNLFIFFFFTFIRRNVRLNWSKSGKN